MAEAMILSAVEKLETLLVKKDDFIEGSDEKVKGLRDDLREMLSLLTHPSMRDIYISLLKDMAHEADAAIDLFILNSDNKSLDYQIIRSRLDRILLGSTRHQYDFFKTIDGIRSSLGALKLEHSRSEAEAEPVETLVSCPTSIWIRESEAVGMDKDVELLLEEAIFDEGRAQGGLATSCIVGMGGVGKTTLAQKLYTHERVASEFGVRAWVYAGFSPKEVLIKELILQLGVEYDEAGEMTRMVDDLRDMVFQHLQRKRYFIVLDHVWRDADLEFFLTAFPDNDKGSRLMLTSRIRDIIGQAHYIHERKILDPSESWKLFLNRVFREYTKCPNHLEEIGRRIVTKCDGLPLAIIEAGDMLAEKEQSESEWSNFLESMDLKSTLAVLELSYHKLPAKLKPCFLHLGSFMEGTTRVKKMIQLWSAGGILISQGEEKNETDEEIGKKYLNELINQCVVEVKERSNRDYRVKYCYMNYNLRVLAVTKAKEEIRFEVRKKNERNSKQSRHCVMYCSREKFGYYTKHDQLLVSLIFRGGVSFDVRSYSWGRFKLLKILDFEGFGLKILPDDVGELRSFKFLGLRNNYIKKLPRSLGRLKRLEVLDIALNFTMEVPDIIWEMDSLRHLYMSDIIYEKPLKIDSLKNLQTLTYITIDNWTYELLGLQMMTNLRKLGIEELDGTSDISKIFASLAQLENLDGLILRGSPFRSMPSLDELGILNRLTQLKLYGLLTKLPSASNFPPNIRYLTLVNTSLEEDPMPVLEKLSKLVFLKLRKAFTGKQMVVSHLGFVELEGLCIGEMLNLRNLQVVEGAMPKLKQLEINKCPYVETLPEDNRLMANLKELKMVTTKGIARKIVDKELGFNSKRWHVNVQP